MKKNITLISITTLFCFAAFTGVFIGCKKATDGLLVHINTNIYTSPMTVHFVNANGKSKTNFPAQFSLALTGSSASYVYTSDGGTKYNVFNGFINLALDRSIHPTPQNPITFTITGSVAGFSNVNYSVKLISDSAVNITIPIIEIANPPADVVITNDVFSITGGTAANAIVAKGTGTNVTATVTIPAQTQFQDANGNLIPSSSLQVNMLQYGTDSLNSLLAIPGGTHPANVLDASGKAIDGGVNFISAGALALNMQADQTAVKHFSQPIQISLDLASGINNYATGQPVKLGDQIPVWSMDEATGIWKSDGTATVVSNGGKLSASFSAAHLSVWQVAWTNSNGLATCTPQSNILNVTMNLSDPKFVGGAYSVALVSPNVPHQVFVYGNTLSLSQGQTIQLDLTGVPGGQMMSIVIFDANLQIVTVSAPFSICNTASVNMTVPVPSASSAINVTLANFTGYCTDKKVAASVTGWISCINVADPSDAFSVYIKNGNVLVPSVGYFQVQDNTTYTVATIYNNSPQSTSIPFKKSDLTFPTGAQYSIQGKANYNTATNMLTLSGNISFQCGQ